MKAAASQTTVAHAASLFFTRFTRLLRSSEQPLALFGLDKLQKSAEWKGLGE
jgi:hypothetical protein